MRVPLQIGSRACALSHLPPYTFTLVCSSRIFHTTFLTRCQFLMLLEKINTIAFYSFPSCAIGKPRHSRALDHPNYRDTLPIDSPFSIGYNEPNSLHAQALGFYGHKRELGSQQASKGKQKSPQASKNHLHVGGRVLPGHPLLLHRLGCRRGSHERPHRDPIPPRGRSHRHNPKSGKREKTPPNH